MNIFSSILRKKQTKETTTMSISPDPIIPAAPGTLYIHFSFFVSSKASEQQVKDGTIRRPVLAWKLVGDRPFPIVVGFPIEIDPEVGGCSGVVVPGSGLILDPLTGKGWGSDELFIRYCVSVWKLWLVEHAPPQPVVAPHPLQHLENVIVSMPH
jgi:hypothetical protein